MKMVAVLDVLWYNGQNVGVSAIRYPLFVYLR